MLLPALALAIAAASTTAPVLRAQQLPSPMLNAGATKQVSPHVWMITGFPNVAIVVGDRATLAVDTGLGARNGATIAAEARKLSKPGARLYLTTTHLHPEHAAGDQGFPADTILIRNAAQQKELESDGDKFITMFRTRSDQWRELLEGQKFRQPDIVFDREARVDLGGGVTARLLWYGAAHSVGDELTFVEPDDALISGDVVQNRVWPTIATDNSTYKSWLAVLEEIHKLPVKIVVPDHTPVGDGSLVTQELELLTELETLTAQAKREGKSSDDAVQAVAAEIKQKHPAWADWTGANSLPIVIKRAYAEQ